MEIEGLVACNTPRFVFTVTLRCGIQLDCSNGVQPHRSADDGKATGQVRLSTIASSCV